MYSRILMSTSSFYRTYPFHQNQNPNMAQPITPGFALIQPEFGGNHHESFYSQPYNAMNLPYQEYQMYPMHETLGQDFNFQQGQDFGFQPGQVNDNVHKTFNYQYSRQQVMNYTVNQSTTQAPPHQLQVERNPQKHVLFVELEGPVYPMSKPRIRWTPELHERFNRAVEELGGYFKAKPKAIQEKMNVMGITTDHLRSHLQKVRNKVHQTTYVEEIMGLGIQNGTGINVPELSEGQRDRLLCKSTNRQKNHRIAPVEDLVNRFNIKDCNCASTSQTSNYHSNLRSDLCDGHA